MLATISARAGMPSRGSSTCDHGDRGRMRGTERMRPRASRESSVHNHVGHALQAEAFLSAGQSYALTMAVTPERSST